MVPAADTSIRVLYFNLNHKVNFPRFLPQFQKKFCHTLLPAKILLSKISHVMFSRSCKKIKKLDFSNIGNITKHQVSLSKAIFLPYCKNWCPRSKGRRCNEGGRKVKKLTCNKLPATNQWHYHCCP